MQWLIYKILPGRHQSERQAKGAVVCMTFKPWLIRSSTIFFRFHNFYKSLILMSFKHNEKNLVKLLEGFFMTIRTFLLNKFKPYSVFLTLYMHRLTRFLWKKKKKTEPKNYKPGMRKRTANSNVLLILDLFYEKGHWFFRTFLMTNEDSLKFILADSTHKQVHSLNLYISEGCSILLSVLFFFDQGILNHRATHEAAMCQLHAGRCSEMLWW